MRKIYTVGLLCSVFLLLPSVSFAETVLRVSDSVSIDVDQTVNGDFYGFAGLSGPVSISGTIEGDAHLIGSSVTTNGTIQGDLMAIGGTSQVHASVTDDVRIVAGEVTIAENVGGDVFVVGGVLTVLSSANIEGSVFFYGGEAEINGRVAGSVFGTSEKLRIDGPVGGNVDVTAVRALVIGDKADIGGDISYQSQNEIIRAQNAVVVGNIVKNTSQGKETTPKEALVPFLIYAFTALISFVLFRRQLEKIVQQSIQSYVKDGLIGVASIISLPVVILLLFLTVIGILVGVLGLFALLLLYISSFVFASAFAGLLIARFAGKSAHLTLLWMILGIVTIEILLLIPFFGSIVVVACTSIVLGTMLRMLYEQLF